MALFGYQQQVQRLIGDVKQMKVAPNDLIVYINMARRQVAELTQCCRVLTPISNSLTTIAVLTPGSGYTSPTVTVSVPDFPSGVLPSPGGLQATAVGHVSGGTFTSITISNFGSGYFQPTVTITDPTGTGATASATVAPINTVNANQEVYPWANAPTGNIPGVGQIFAVKSVSIIFDNLRYTLPCYSFSTYQTFIRNYPSQYSYVPTVVTQYGQGVNGSFYYYPQPQQTYQTEWDGFALPIDLVDDTTVDAIPHPWADSVPYYAAYLAFLEMQQGNDAERMLALFDKMLLRQSVAARPGRASNNRGRW